MITNFENFINESSKPTGSKKTLINRIYKALDPVKGKIYSDEAWQGVTEFQRIIEQVPQVLGVYMSCEHGGYRSIGIAPNQKEFISYQRSFGRTPEWKEYKVRIEWNGGESITGILTCSPAGSQEDPFDRYDISIILK